MRRRLVRYLLLFATLSSAYIWLGASAAMLVLLWFRSWPRAVPCWPAPSARLIWRIDSALCFTQDGQKHWVFRDEALPATYAALRRELLSRARRV